MNSQLPRVPWGRATRLGNILCEGSTSSTARCCIFDARPHVVLAPNKPTWNRLPQRRVYSRMAPSLSSPFVKGGAPKSIRRKRFVPRKAAVKLTEQARKFFKHLLDANPEKGGILLNYHQASSGEPRMVFSFGFVNTDELSPEDEGVSLEILEDGSPKPPEQSFDDGLPKLYVHHNAFMKVLGATVDVDTQDIVPVLTDREGNRLDPNA